jgi:integrase
VVAPPKGMRGTKVAKRQRRSTSSATPSPTTALARTGPRALARIDVEEDLRAAADLASSSVSPNTRRAYRSDIADWLEYARAAGASALPAEPAAIAAYVANMDRKRGLKPSTIRRRCAAIAKLHKDKGHPSPIGNDMVRKVLQGLARTNRTPQTKKMPLSADLVREIVLDAKTSKRDRAIILVGVVTSMRRSELASLRWPDVAKHREGYVIHVPFSKTDQTGKGMVKALPRSPDEATCPVRALDEWRAASTRRGGNKDELVFRCSEQTIANVVKRLVGRTGADVADYGGHSLRAGMMTIASEEGIALTESMKQSGHKSMSVASGYVRSAEIFQGQAPKAVLNAVARGSTKRKK